MRHIRLWGAHADETMRPRGAATRTSSRAAARWSGAYMAPNTDSTASADRRLQVVPVRLPRPSSARCRLPALAARPTAATPAPGRSRSPRAPRAAASSAALPVPVATSTTRSPIEMSATSTTNRAAGSSASAISAYSPAPRSSLPQPPASFQRVEGAAFGGVRGAARAPPAPLWQFVCEADGYRDGAVGLAPRFPTFGRALGAGPPD